MMKMKKGKKSSKAGIIELPEDQTKVQSEDQPKVQSEDQPKVQSEDQAKVQEAIAADLQDSNQPQTSPYRSGFHALRLGDEIEKIYVPSPYINKYAKLSSSSQFTQIDMWTNSQEWSLSIPDVDKDVVHTLVHFLFTGTYQNLQQTSASYEDAASTEYRRSVLIYNLAKSYELDSLSFLAFEKMETFATKISIYKMLEIASSMAAKNLNDDHCIVQHFRSKLDLLIQEDVSVLRQGQLLESVSNAALNAVLMKAMMEICATKLESACKREKQIPQESCWEESVRTENTTAELHEVTVKEAEVTPTDASLTVNIDGTPLVAEHVKDIPFDMVDRTDTVIVEPVPMDSAVGEPASPTSHTKHQGQSHQDTTPSSGCSKLELDTWEFGVSIDKKNECKKAVVLDSWGVEVCEEKDKVDNVDEDSWGFTGFSAKKEKTKKITAPPINLEDTLKDDGFNNQPDQSGRDEWSLGWGDNGTKKSKNRDAPLLMNEVIPDLSQEPLKEPAPPIEPPAEEPPAEEPPAEEPPAEEPLPLDDDWGFLSKKKTKKGKKAKAAEPESPLEEYDWGFGRTSKKKKGKETKAPEPEPVVEPIEEPIKISAEPVLDYPEPDTGLPNDEVYAIPDSDAADVPTTIQAIPTSPSSKSVQESGLCELRAQHLLNGDQWRHCALCRAMVVQVAIQAAQQENGMERGYDFVEKTVVG